MGAFTIPFALLAAAGVVGLAYMAAAYLWRLLVVAAATTLGGVW